MKFLVQKLITDHRDYQALQQKLGRNRSILFFTTKYLSKYQTPLSAPLEVQTNYTLISVRTET